jgi:hypothetical protein
MKIQADAVVFIELIVNVDVAPYHSLISLFRVNY